MKLRQMYHGGDKTLAEWETTTSPERLKEIEDEFNQYLANGWFAANMTTTKLIRDFDPNADILLIPRMAGGK